MDEDAGGLRGAFDHLNVAQVWIDDMPTLRGRDDSEVVRWARQNKHIILTFNTRDYWPDTRVCHLHQCYGIISIALENNGIDQGRAARLIENLLRQLGFKVPVAWWKYTKVKVTGTHYVVRRYVRGQKIQYKIIEASNAVLYFRQVRR